MKHITSLCLLMCVLLAACGDDSSTTDDTTHQDTNTTPESNTTGVTGNATTGDTTSNTGPTGPPSEFPQEDRSTLDFIVTEMNFYFPEGIEPSSNTVANPCGLDAGTDNTTYQPLNLDGLPVDGFDLDGAASDGSEGFCTPSDYANSDGVMGIDYAFLRVIDMVRPARPGQTIQTVLATAPSQGLLKVGLRAEGIDSLENDDDVTLIAFNTLNTPLLGADGRILGRSSVAADPEFQTRFQGQIVDGVLTATADKLTVRNINLLVIENRVIELHDVRIRATFSERPNGVLDIESLVSGWWMHDNMLDAINYALTTIGANNGELDCVLGTWSDYSSDGVNCDGMSMIFRVTAVSGFITGLEPPQGGSDAQE
ncbi:MAG: hypothetical protein AAFS10_23275 [Myxococcota bacterium]